MIYDDQPELPPVDVLFFEVGNAVYGTDASQVLRIERATADVPALPELGPLARGSRALVFHTPEGEGRLRVDSIRGVRPVTPQELRRLPPLVSAAHYAIGLYLDAERPVLLIDLEGTAQSAEGRH
jgi:hypothetical protein